MSKSRKKRTPKRALARPDLEQAKSFVLNTLPSVSGRPRWQLAHSRSGQTPAGAVGHVTRKTKPRYFGDADRLRPPPRRGELPMDSIQVREEQRVIADLTGNAGHIRTVPIPQWVKAAVDVWRAAAGITEGTLFRSIDKSGSVWGNGMTPKVLWEVVKESASRAASRNWRPMTYGGHALAYAILPAENSTKSSSCSGTSRFKRSSDTFGCKQGWVAPLTTGSELSLSAACNSSGAVLRRGLDQPVPWRLLAGKGRKCVWLYSSA